MIRTNVYNTPHTEMLHNLVRTVKQGQPDHPYIYFKRKNGNIEISPYGLPTFSISGNSGIVSELADIINTNESKSYKAYLWYKTWKEATLGDLIIFAYDTQKAVSGTIATIIVGQATAPNTAPTNLDGKIVISVNINKGSYTFSVNGVSFTTTLEIGVNVIAVHVSTTTAFVNGMPVTTVPDATTTTLGNADKATPLTETALAATTYNAISVSMDPSIVSLVEMPYLGNDDLLQSKIQAYSTTESSSMSGTFYSNIYETSQISTSPPIVGIATDPPLLSGDPRIKIFMRGSTEPPTYANFYKGHAQNTDKPMMKDGKYYMLISQDRATTYQLDYDVSDLWPFASEWISVDNLKTIPETWAYFQMKVIINLKAKTAEYAENTISNNTVINTGNGDERYYTNDANVNKTNLTDYIHPAGNDGVLIGTYQRHFPENHVFGYEGKLIHFSGDVNALSTDAPYWKGASWIIPKPIGDTRLPLISSNADAAEIITKFITKELTLPDESFKDNIQRTFVYSGGYGAVVKSVNQDLDPNDKSIIKIILPDDVDPPELELFGRDHHTQGVLQPGWSVSTALHKSENPYTEEDVLNTGYYYNVLYLRGPYANDVQIYLSEITQDGHLVIRVRVDNQVIYEGTATNAFYQGYNAEQIHAFNLHYERSSLCHYEDNKQLDH